MKKSDQYRKSPRLPGYDYGSPGAYFITICTRDRRHFLGKVKEGVMLLSAAGEVAREEWLQSAEIRKEVFLGEWIIMPNHLHGIVWIGDPAEVDWPAPHRLPQTPGYLNQFGPQRKSLSTMINQFKGAVTRGCAKAGLGALGWQERYHDRIIRDAAEYARIENYIRNNPPKWNDDEFNR